MIEAIKRFFDTPVLRTRIIELSHANAMLRHEIKQNERLIDFLETDRKKKIREAARLRIKLGKGENT
ncbi:MAG: hypothetical protein GOVbin4685_62 [Prokaryotic dsDNA virus sp.]|jgi:hypothetical protein|nr:MAG: hypothetical protein GOVbin4685_62 [Prokaryotic dsDNA virus sp.]|tara:strand:+ start:2594 stop:2794 length:201 start_codon:yes stop_codon:yes gene_type:complete